MYLGHLKGERYFFIETNQEQVNSRVTEIKTHGTWSLKVSVFAANLEI